MLELTYKCFRCGEGHTKFFDLEDHPLSNVPSRDCPSCLEKHTLFTHQEMADILNNMYLAGADIDLFGPPKGDEE